MNAPESTELLFSRSPRISLPQVRRWLDRQKQGDEAVKKDLIRFIDHRLRGRYITPLLHVEPTKFKSGFLTMASACLLIETLQTFRDGKNESPSGSEDAFKRFLKDHETYFPGLRNAFPLVSKIGKNGRPVEKCTFYKHIRCGILHQAESTGRYSVVRDKTPLFEVGKRTTTVNGDKFLEAIKVCLDKYISELWLDSIVSEPWNAAAAKLECICDNFEHGHH